MAKRRSRKITPEHERKAALLLIEGFGPTDAARKLSESSGLPLDDAGLAVERARDAIALAADTNRREQFGIAIERLGLIIRKSIGDDVSEISKDPATALRAQDQLNKLLRLFEPMSGDPDPEQGGSDAQRELAEIRGHLSSVLGFDPADDYPAGELARMAAAKIRSGANAKNRS